LEYFSQIESTTLARRIRQYAMLLSAIDLMQWAARERIDHIHGHTCADGAHVLALAQRMGGPPYSLTLHGDLPIYGKDHHAKMQRAAFVNAVGGHLRQQIIERTGLSENRVFVTCMGVETTELTSLGRNRSFTPRSLQLLTVARLHPTKGHMHALAAVHLGVQAGLDLHYTIAGEGPNKDAIAARITELGLEHRATLTGTVSESDVYRLLSDADAFILPSTGMGEAWPVSVMEAMGAGLPVIATRIGATPDMIKPGEDGFLVPQADEQAIFEKLELLADQPELRRRIGDHARRTASERFDVATSATRLIDAIRDSLTGSDQATMNLRQFSSTSVEQ
jgi:colanic acid/amylovoran biosynthesis glycosyltransferase